MGATAFAAASLAVAGYSAYKNSQRPSEPTVPTLPPAPAGVDKAQAVANQQAAMAAVRQRQRAAGAKGQSSTILTGPMGIPNPPAPGKSQLLGL